MKLIRYGWIACALAAALVAMPRAGAEEQAAEQPKLQVGDRAPDFDTRDHTGKRRRLKDHQGKDWVILSFHVLDDTPG